jgi:hypothetical protein
MVTSWSRGQRSWPLGGNLAGPRLRAMHTGYRRRLAAYETHDNAGISGRHDSWYSQLQDGAVGASNR